MRSSRLWVWSETDPDTDNAGLGPGQGESPRAIECSVRRERVSEREIVTIISEIPGLIALCTEEV